MASSSTLGWIEALLLGVVQGLTEFLPISSDGHLAITQIGFDAIRGTSVPGAQKLFFDVMLHLGTLAAIVVYYRKAVGLGLRGLLGATDVPPEFQRRSLIRTGMLGFVACLPLVPYALGLKKLIEHTFESLTAAGVGFLITAAVLALTGRLKGGSKGPAETTWLDAFLIGLAQAFAPLPGVSRSGLTIASALALGLSRPWAVGFSLLLAVPTILAANVLEIKDADLSALGPERMAQLAAATIVAGLVGYAAISWLVRIVQSGRLWYFSVYLVIVAIAVLAVALARGDGPHVGRAEAVERPLRISPARPGDSPGSGRAVKPLAPALAAGPAASAGASGSVCGCDRRPARLVLGGPLDGHRLGG